MTETCARCGHTSGGCQHCGRHDDYLGAQINKASYCHQDWNTEPTCYMQTSWEQTRAAMADDHLLVWVWDGTKDFR